MTILVFGETGQLARALAEGGVLAGHPLTFAGRARCDLATCGGLDDLFAQTAPALVINAAAYTAVDAAEDDEASAMAINAAAPGKIAAACAAADIPLIHISTDYVYDGAAPRAYVETDATEPRSAYGRTKLEGEWRVMDACPRHLILRTAWLYGPHGNNFVRTMLRLGQERDTLRVVADQHGSPTYVPHLAQAVRGIAETVLGARDFDGWGIYHAAGSGSATWCDLARTTFAAAQRPLGVSATVEPIATADYPTKAERPMNSVLDTGKLEHMFGIRLPRWQDGVTACIERLAVPAEAGRAV